MWTCIVTLDADKTDVGTATASFTENGLTFTYSARLRVTVAQRDAFIAAAIAGRNVWRTRVVAEASYVTNLNNAFAAADI